MCTIKEALFAQMELLYINQRVNNTYKMVGMQTFGEFFAIFFFLLAKRLTFILWNNQKRIYSEDTNGSGSGSHPFEFSNVTNRSLRM